MRLSQAIRIGSVIRKQSFTNPIWSVDTSCALAAAYEAVTGELPASTGHAIRELGKLIEPTLRVSHPIRGYTELIWHVIWNLNDTHRWSRERIADFIETIENELYGSIPEEKVLEEVA